MFVKLVGMESAASATQPFGNEKRKCGPYVFSKQDVEEWVFGCISFVLYNNLKLFVNIRNNL